MATTTTTIRDDYGARAVIRVRFGRHRVDLPWADVDTSRISTDGQVRTAVAAALGVPAADLATAAVDRLPDGNLRVRPTSTFG